jgi:3D (Asp-Asp-Asp) domain-containing protein
VKISRILAATMVPVCFGLSTAQAQDTSATSPQVETEVVQSPNVPGTEATMETTTTAKVVQAIVTAYANGSDGGAASSMTASGVRTHWGTVAADWRLYPVGTRLQIDGFPDVIFTVEDAGSAVRGNIFDIWFPDLPSAASFGTKSLKVTILP